jgi:hypothetical protein
MTSVTVLHLVRKSNGAAPLQRFRDSYVRHEAGIPHDLKALCKGFERSDDVEAVFEGVGRPCEFQVISDEGFDISAYFKGAAGVATEFVCFLNSYSEIRVDGWLDRLVAAARPSDVGAAGASASYESTLTSALNLVRGQWLSLMRRPREMMPRLAAIMRAAPLFPRWPNPHLRTNAFIIRSAVFKSLSLAGSSRRAALAFESGYDGMTRQLNRRGLKVLVAGSDGRTFEQTAWPRSDTFQSGDQGNLLVHDNHTRLYQEASEEERRRLSRRAWGGHSPS